MSGRLRHFSAAGLIVFASVALGLPPALDTSAGGIVRLGCFALAIALAYVLMLAMIAALQTRLASASPWTILAAVATLALAIKGFAGVF